PPAVTETPVVPTNPPAVSAFKVNDTFEVGGASYRITDATEGKLSVTYVKLISKKAVKAIVPATVKYMDAQFKVTKIGPSAFAKCNKLKTLIIEKNVEEIGSNAFSGCGSLKKVSVKTTALKKVGAKALKKVNKKCVIKVPKGYKKAYDKLFKKKGQAKSVKVK
ncbi:MAG: leucine-rich repeat protein, partial [Lachnospiraceae bacterium]|nr:leucine-rich repeat protein [Lachnospiraceae bacterium]